MILINSVTKKQIIPPKTVKNTAIKYLIVVNATLIFTIP